MIKNLLQVWLRNKFWNSSTHTHTYEFSNNIRLFQHDKYFHFMQNKENVLAFIWEYQFMVCVHTYAHATSYYLQQKYWLMSALCIYASIYTILSSTRCMFLKLYIRKYSLNDARQARVNLPFEMHYLPIYMNYNTIERE